MGQPFVGEIRMFGGNFAPAGWNFCDGSLLSISENETLFQLIGTTYGGDGQNTFGLPDLRGRIPVHQGGGFTLAQSGGTETVTLILQQIPGHNHPLPCQSGSGSQASPANGLWASSGANPYASGSANVAMNAANIGPNAPSNQSHDNMMPYLAVNFIISLFGIFPSPN